MDDGEPVTEVRRLRPPLAHSPAHALVSASVCLIFQGHSLKNANLLPYSQHNCLLDTAQKGFIQILSLSRLCCKGLHSVYQAQIPQLFRA